MVDICGETYRSCLHEGGKPLTFLLFGNSSPEQLGISWRSHLVLTTIILCWLQCTSVIVLAVRAGGTKLCQQRRWYPLRGRQPFGGTAMRAEHSACLNQRNATQANKKQHSKLAQRRTFIYFTHGKWNPSVSDTCFFGTKNGIHITTVLLYYCNYSILVFVRLRDSIPSRAFQILL